MSPAADGLLNRPTSPAYLNLPPSPPVPNGTFTASVAYPNLTFQGAIAVRPVPGTTRLWIIEREGRIWSIEDDPAATTKTLVLDLNDDDVDPTDGTPNAGHLTNGVRWWCQGWDDCGLMGLAFHPEFGQAGSPNRGYFYLGYQAKSTVPLVGGAGADYRPDSSTGAANTSNRIARFTIADGNISADPTSEQILTDQPDRHLWHNGGDLFFGSDGFLYGVNGDEGSAHDPWQNSQRITRGLFSGVIRIDVDYTAGSTRSHAPPPRQTGQPTLYPGYGIPNDNPWVGVPGVLEELYAIGLRSPHRMTFDPVTGHILVGDIGQGSREEVTLITRGSNHQWGYMEGFASKRVDGGMKNERSPPPYATASAVTAGTSVVPLTYTAPAADTTLPPGMLASGDRVRFGDQLAQVLSVPTWPYANVTLNAALSQGVAAGTSMVRTTGLQVTRAITAADSTPDNINVPSGLGTTTMPVSGIGLVPLGLCVSFGVNGEYGSHQVIAVSDNGASTTSITVRPRLTADLPSGTWVDRLTVIGNETAPVADFLHGGATALNAILGGYIYRGPAHPDLHGAYLFADNPRGTVYSLTGIGTLAPVITKLFDFPNYTNVGNGGYRGLSGFGHNHDGEVLICRMQTNTGPTNTSSGQIYKIIRTGGTVIGTPIPTDLAQTGAFATDGDGNLILPLQPNTALVPYGVNSPLWSDNALKTRWIALPNPSGRTSGFTADEQATFTSTGAFAFPQGTVFVKHFELEDHAFPSHRRMLETRFLVRSPDSSVYGVTYKWNATQTAATLLSEGLNETYTITHADTTTHQQTWSYPSRDDCLSCHNTGAGHVLGVSTRQLNGNFTYPGTGISDNQLSTWSHIGMFANPPADGAIAGLARLVPVGDTGATLDHRVRSWLDANCSHCHRPGGVHAEFDARYDTPLENQNLIDGPVNNALGIPFARVIAPKGIDRSILHLRDNGLAAGTKMPPLAKNQVDTAAIAALEAWIMSMDVPLMVELTAPTHNSVVQVGQPLTINASTGFSEDVTRVEFFVDGTSLGSDTSAPYTRSWTPATSGNYVLTAVVHDGTGTTTSPAITVKVTDLPSVTLTAPIDSASDQAPGWFTLTADAQDTDGTIALVEFLRDGVVFATSTTAPYGATLRNLAAGSYVLSARATDNVGGIATSAPVNVTVTGLSGLKAEYWTNLTFTGSPAVTRTEAGVDYVWDNNAPLVGIPADNFTVRWSGTVTAPATGTYIFYTTTDDGVRLWVDGVQLIDKWVDQGATTWTGTAALVAGQAVTIRMDYYEKTGGASAKLEWSSAGAGVARAVIPSGALTPPPVAPSVTLTTPTTSTTSAPAAIALAATASDSDGVITQVEFLRDGVVVASDATAPYAASDGPLPAGTYVYTARATDSQGLTTTSTSATVTVQKSTAAIVLGNLTHTYDGSPHPTTASTAPTGLTVTITYDGSTTAPTAAGSYAVIATIVDGSYEGSDSGTLTIAKAGATVTLSQLTQTVDGTPKPVQVTTVPSGLTTTVTYDGSTTPPSTIGSYTVVATVNDSNYQGTASGTLAVIAEPTILLTPPITSEGDSGILNAGVTAQLSVASSNTITVDWTADPGTATAGSDFTTVSGTLTFAPGETGKVISVPIIGDTTVEPDETVIVTLSNPVGVQLGTTSAVLTIINDDTSGGSGGGGGGSGGGGGCGLGGGIASLLALLLVGLHRRRLR